VKNRFDKMQPVALYLLATLFFFTITIVRGFDRLRYAGIWAEDGRIFLKQAYEWGWISLFQPYAGYFHTVPRLIAQLSTYFPVHFVPYFIVLTSYMLFAAIISMPLLPYYRWLYRDRFYAFLVVILLALSPGQETMMGNLTNLHWYLLLYLAILGLKDISKQFSFWELIFAFLSVASEGAAIVLLPLFLVRIYLKYNSESSFRFRSIVGDVAVLFLIILFTCFNYSIRTDHSSAVLSLSQAYIFILHLMSFVLVYPFTGDYLIMVIISSIFLLTVVSAISLFFVAACLKNTWRKEYLLVVTMVCCSLLLPVMISMVRLENLEILKNFYDRDTYLWFRFRYSFFVPASAFLFWVFILQCKNKKKWLSFLLLGVLVFSQSVLNSYRFTVHEYGKENDWGAKSTLLEQSLATGCPQSVTIDIFPGKWQVTIHSPKKRCSAE